MRIWTAGMTLVFALVGGCSMETEEPAIDDGDEDDLDDLDASAGKLDAVVEFTLDDDMPLKSFSNSCPHLGGCELGATFFTSLPLGIDSAERVVVTLARVRVWSESDPTYDVSQPYEVVSFDRSGKYEVYERR